MNQLKVYFVIAQITAVMVFFQNCSEVELKSYAQEELGAAIDLSNEYPYKGEAVNHENQNLLDELKDSQLAECESYSDEESSVEEKARNCRISICHAHGGQSEESHTIKISVMALDAHVEEAGLDYVGSCDHEPEPAPMLVDEDGVVSYGEDNSEG